MPTMDPEADMKMAHLNAGRTTGVGKVVAWISTPTHATGWYQGQIPIMSTMWESSRLPEQFREGLHNFETIIVPSQQNLELFSTYHDNVHLVPLGVDPRRWHFVERQTPTTEFRFLIGGSGPRKGTDLARKAFRLAFPDLDRMQPRPKLIMKSPKGEEVFGGAGIEVIGGRLTDEDEVALYESAHCYVQPSRGEGFGLQPLQAMAQGIPTILTGAHGHAGFADLGIPLDYTMEKSAYFIYGDAGDWWEPDLDQLVDAMRSVYLNYTAACVHAFNSAWEIAQRWTWKHTADSFLDVVGRDNLTELDPGRPWRLWSAHRAGHQDTVPFKKRWFSPTFKKYKVVTLRDYVSDIGGTMRYFVKGQDYWEPADVKRILFESGILDPVCLVAESGSLEDIGLAEAQLEEVKAYSAAHSHCPTCGQELNSSPTRADKIYWELEADRGGDSG